MRLPEARRDWVPGRKPFEPEPWSFELSAPEQALYLRDLDDFAQGIHAVLHHYRIRMSYQELLDADEDLFALVINLVNKFCKTYPAWSLKNFGAGWLGRNHRFAEYDPFGDEIYPILYVPVQFEDKLVQVSFHLMNLSTKGFRATPEAIFKPISAMKRARVLLRWQLRLRVGGRTAMMARNEFVSWFAEAQKKSVGRYVPVGIRNWREYRWFNDGSDV